MGALAPWFPLYRCDAAWSAFYAYWFIQGRRARRNAQRESAASRGITLALMALAFLLLFLPAGAQPGWWRGGPGGLRMLAGAALLAGGLGVAIWARRYLAAYWSGSVALKDDHRLIRTGPYARVRHPIYLGLLLALVGTALVLGTMWGALGVLVGTGGFVRKMRQEDRLLDAQFGDAFRAYQREVPALVPRRL